MFGHQKASSRIDASRKSPLFRREGCLLLCCQAYLSASLSGQGKPSSSPALWAQSSM